MDEYIMMKLEASNDEYRDRINKIHDALLDLVEEIDNLVDDYCKTRTIAERVGVDFEEDMFSDCVDWIEKFENLKEYVNAAHIFS